MTTAAPRGVAARASDRPSRLSSFVSSDTLAVSCSRRLVLPSGPLHEARRVRGGVNPGPDWRAHTTPPPRPPRPKSGGGPKRGQKAEGGAGNEGGKEKAEHAEDGGGGRGH